MLHTRHHIVCVGSLLVLVALAVSVIAGCGNPSQPVTKRPATPVIPPAPKDPKPVTVVAGQATTLDLGGGADLIIPPGAMTPGATVRATYQDRPGGNWIDIEPTLAPVQLISSPPNAIHGLLTLEFPVPVNKIAPGVDPAVQFGVSTYNPSTKIWTPFNSVYDSARHMVVAQIPHFSWWNPFTWDVGSVFTRVAQDFGEVAGSRAGPASCSGRAPAWVGSLAGITNDADIAIRSCAQAQGNILDVEMVNNRPYGQILTYGSSVKWGWHQGATSLWDIARDRFMDTNMTRNELYLPPLGRASVGIYEPAAGTNMIFHIGPTKFSIGADLAFYLLSQVIGKAIDKVPNFGTCASFDTQASLGDTSPSALRDDLVGVIGCVEQGFPDLIKTGVLDKMKADELATIAGRITAASVVADGIEFVGTVSGVTWKISDLVADNWLVNSGSLLGNGFSVYAKARLLPPTPTPTPATQPQVPPSTPTPVQPYQLPTPTSMPQPPTPTPAPAPPPPTYPETAGGNANTWTNYMNAGGTQGPTVPAYATIQIACRLTGFKVADGNTWWYRIAQSPWNDAYYVSADAFYNNGQTSGSLSGTPFYDPNVPTC